MRFPLRFTFIELAIALNCLSKSSGAGFREPGLGGQNAFMGGENQSKIEVWHANHFGSRGNRDVFGVGLGALSCDFRFVSRALNWQLR